MTSERKYANEVTGGMWYGVTLPSWLRAFDCRADMSDFAPESSWGAPLFGSQRAEVDMGLRTKDDRFACTPISCQTYIDARKADMQELCRQVTDMVNSATGLRADYESAKAAAKEPSNGGSCYYMPVAICLSNFGWSIMCDNRTVVVRSFT
jgi:hypothetical protein